MKAVKIIVIVFLVYAGIVAVFESTLGYFQPKDASNLVIATVDANGNTKERVVSRIESGGQLYVAANHWPRRWYNDVLAHPEVQVTSDGKTQAYVAVPVTGEEFERVNADHRLGMVIRILTGFPPRRLVRLDPA
ncbi:MAG: nitroreductase/quinone reductase family protein [Proteobacteria bacterium]|nr:nitroreductase/quinone reductase family protein [Pseudomonadota bacterium]